MKQKKNLIILLGGPERNMKERIIYSFTNFPVNEADVLFTGFEEEFTFFKKFIGKSFPEVKEVGIIDKMGGYFERKSSINLNFLHFFNHLWIPIFCFKCQNTASNEFVVVGSCIFSFRNS